MPEGATVVFSAHGVAPVVHERGRARGAAAPSTPPARWSPRCTTRPSASPTTTTTSCSSATRATRRSWAPPARRPSTSSSSTGPTTSPTSTVRDPEQGGLALADHAVGRRDDGDRRGGCASASPRCWTRPATTSATPPRTASSRSRRSPPTSDLVIVVGSRNSSNSVRLVEVALEAGAAAAYRVDDADEIDEAWLEGVDDRRRHLRRVGARDPGRGVLDLPRRARLRRRRGGRRGRGVAASSRCPTSCAATSRPPASPTRWCTTRASPKPARCTDDREAR